MSFKKVVLVLLLVIVVGSIGGLSNGRIQAASSDNFDHPQEGQMGQVNIQIPAKALSGQTEIQIVPLSGMNVQATAGMMQSPPVIVNAVVHQDSLILTTHLLTPQPGPVDVTVYWRVD